MSAVEQENSGFYFDPARGDSWITNPKTGEVILAGYSQIQGPMLDRWEYMNQRVNRIEQMLETLLARLEKAAERD